MPVHNFSISATADLVTPPSGKSIQIVAFWFELANDWTAGNIFALRDKSKGESLFPKTVKGLAAMNLVGCSRLVTLSPDGILEGYISAGAKTVRGTIVYKIL